MRKTYLTLNTLYNFPNVGCRAVLQLAMLKREVCLRREEKGRSVPTDIVQCFKMIRYLWNSSRNNSLIQRHLITLTTIHRGGQYEKHSQCETNSHKEFSYQSRIHWFRIRII